MHPRSGAGWPILNGESEASALLTGQEGKGEDRFTRTGKAKAKPPLGTLPADAVQGLGLPTAADSRNSFHSYPFCLS